MLFPSVCRLAIRRREAKNNFISCQLSLSLISLYAILFSCQEKIFYIASICSPLWRAPCRLPCFSVARPCLPVRAKHTPPCQYLSSNRARIWFFSFPFLKRKYLNKNSFFWSCISTNSIFLLCLIMLLLCVV